MEDKMEDMISFKPGDSIVPVSAPFIKVLHPSQKGKLCDYCFQPKTLQPCTGCNLMYYCGKDCQEQDGKEGHTLECTSVVFKEPPGDEMVQQDLAPKLLRTLAKFIHNPESFDEQYKVYGAVQRSFNDLMSRAETTRKDHRPSKFVSTLSDKLSVDTAFGTPGFSTENFLSNAFGVWKRNGFDILDSTESWKIGTGIYVPHSFISHGCRPNAVRVSNLDFMEIRAIHPIPKGEATVISYLAGNLKPDERQKVLRARYNFICQCDLCTLEKYEPLIDYDKLPDIITKLASFNGSTVEIATELRNEGLELFNKLYHEYDERTTKFCIIYFDVIRGCQMQHHTISQSDLQKAADDVQKRILMTFGNKSNKHAEFIRNVSAILG